MKFKTRQKAIVALAGSAFLATFGMTGAVQADVDSPFVALDLDSGYQLAAKGEAEGKCGEGKCGDAKDDAKGDAEGKCGEGKCGGAGDDKGDAEGKCGEGKCGGAA